MVSKKLRKVMHRSLAVATSAILIATASIGAGFTVSAEGDYEDAKETVVSDPNSSNPDEQSSKEVGNITSDYEGIIVSNGGSVTAHGDVEAKGTGISNEGGTVTVDGNVTANANEGSTQEYGIVVNGGSVEVKGNVTGAIDGIDVTGGGEVTVGGNVTGLTDDGIAIYKNYDDEDREVSGTVTVEGNVTGVWGLYINNGKVDVSGNVTGDVTGVTADSKSDIKVGGDVTGDKNGIRSDDSTISVEGSVKGSKETGIESRGSNITVEKDVDGNVIGIEASTRKKYVYNEPVVSGEGYATIYVGEDGECAARYVEEDGEYGKIEEIPSNVNVGGNVTGGAFGVLSDNGSTVHVKGDVTASGKIEMEETEDEEFDDSEMEMYSKIPSAAIGIIIGMDNDDGPRLRALELSDDEDVDPETGANSEEGNQKPEPVKGIVIVEETVKAEDNDNGAYGVLLLNKGYETAAEVIAATPDIVVYEFNLGDNAEVVGYQDYDSVFDFSEYYEFRPVPMLAATNEENPVDEDDIDDEPSDDADELAAEVIDTVKGLINYIIKHDKEVTLDFLNDGEDVRVFGDGLETMRIGEVLNITFQEGYELDNEDYLKTIASVEKISDGVYKITLNSELGGINIKALKKAIEEEIIDPVVDPDEPDNKEDDPKEKPQEETNDDPVVVIIEESDPDPAPDSESDPEPASAPAPAVVPLVATTVAPAPAPAPTEPAVLGEKREAAVLGARKASTDDTTNLPIRAMIIIIASLGALIVCGTKYCVKER
ncbi:hypothetical protein SAMN02910276_00306 [Butyrivibrio sp. Su6]|uniref:hypothetical protein n=1 Tax=Butyrivibrio sp. Su6 TaxID=1520810 RepID=UPI00089EE08A|nr:hypothetical protein [Butyrivibrio sp. Su6]SEF46997.1 hypothetical protein SAMN02910276_00306 [Butyrivibrio sp. Su6]